MRTLELLLDRRFKKPKYTIGKLYLDGVYFSDTLEDTCRDLTQPMALSDINRIKVFGETAIPRGRYRITMDVVSPRFATRVWARPYGGKIPRLLNVPGYDGILIHVLNTPEETHGCIGVGVNSEVGKITRSTEFFNRLMDILVKANRDGREIWITII